MNQQIVVTNVRMPQYDYRQIKAIAGELGMSVNEYVHITVKNDVKKRQSIKNKHLHSFYDEMKKIIDTPHTGKPMGLSKEDEIIYGI